MKLVGEKIEAATLAGQVARMVTDVRCILFESLGACHDVQPTLSLCQILDDGQADA